MSELWFPNQRRREKKEEQKKKKKKITIISIVAAILIIVIGSVYFIYHTNTVKEQENAAWTQLQTSTNVIDFDHFISEFPNGQHAEDAKTLRTKLVQALEKWNMIEASTDYQTFWTTFKIIQVVL